MREVQASKTGDRSAAQLAPPGDRAGTDEGAFDQADSRPYGHFDSRHEIPPGASQSGSTQVNDLESTVRDHTCIILVLVRRTVIVPVSNIVLVATTRSGDGAALRLPATIIFLLWNARRDE